jgi:hypothetical protein
LQRRRAITPDNPGPADVQFTINGGQNVREISPYIYGINFYHSAGFSAPATLDRLGGNRWTGYNWETNASNAGADYYHHSDYYLVGGATNTPPGAAVQSSIESAESAGRGLIVTVPMAGYVSADANGTVDETEVAPSPRWKQVVAKKTAIYPGSSLSLTPNETDGYVFTDELINWVETTRNQQSNPPPVFYSLDNEPALWGEALPPGWQSGIEGVLNPSSGGRTHPLIHPYAPTFAEMKTKTIAHASAIKDVSPDSLVFGGVGYGYAEFTGLQGASDATSSPSHPGGNQGGELNYLEWLLREVRNEEIIQGRKLMDVLDVHWYPEATGGGTRIAFDNNPNPSAALIQARVQAPRSLWDTTYTETSWITGCCSGGPIKLLKHLQRDVDDFNPGTKLAITEYNYGGGAHISGGIAQADVLGVFGREGLFAATLWPIASGGQSQFTNAAFKMYLNYDGAGGEFGDTSVQANTSSIANSAVYASVDADDPTKMILVAINRTGSPLDTGLAVTSDFRFDRAEVFQLTSASSNPVQVSDILISQVNAFHYTMPAYSVSTVVLHAATQPGDFDFDGDVDGRDFLVWQRNPSIGSLGDWQANYGVGALGALKLSPPAIESLNSGASPVPEPGCALLAWLGFFAMVGMRPSMIC